MEITIEIDDCINTIKKVKNKEKIELLNSDLTERIEYSADLVNEY